MSHHHDKKFQLNIGFIVFAIIFVYLTVTVCFNLMKEHISVCRVEEGQIVNSSLFTGVCIRNEEVITATQDGYINFFVGEGDKVAKSGNIYLLNQNPPEEDSNTLNQSVTSSQNYSEIRDQITVFTKNFTDSQYAQVYSLNYSMDSLSTKMISESEIKNYKTNSSSSKAIKAPSSGIVSYSYDGYESLSISDITHDVLYNSSHEIKQIDPYTYVQEGMPVYKLVHDHKWQIVIPLSDSQVTELEDVTQVHITFSKDNIATDADFYIHNGSDGNYGVLTLNDYMVRYISERYIDIEIVFLEVSGLKIPSSSLVQKDFYKIPIQYLIEDSRSYETGFFCEKINEDGELVADFRTSGIYYQDESYFYVSTEDFTLGDYIGKAQTGKKDDRFQIGATGKLDGVYNVNKGYTQFEIVNVLHKKNDYCIVEENLNYSISLYDNIILNSKNVTENEIVY